MCAIRYCIDEDARLAAAAGVRRALLGPSSSSTKTTPLYFIYYLSACLGEAARHLRPDKRVGRCLVWRSIWWAGGTTAHVTTTARQGTCTIKKFYELGRCQESKHCCMAGICSADGKVEGGKSTGFSMYTGTTSTHRARTVHRPKQTGFADQLVEQAFLADEFSRRVKLLHFAVVEYYNAIAIEDSVDAVMKSEHTNVLCCTCPSLPMGDRDDSAIFEHVASEGSL